MQHPRADDSPTRTCRHLRWERITRFSGGRENGGETVLRLKENRAVVGTLACPSDWRCWEGQRLLDACVLVEKAVLPFMGGGTRLISCSAMDQTDGLSTHLLRRLGCRAAERAQSLVEQVLRGIAGFVWTGAASLVQQAAQVAGEIRGQAGGKTGGQLGL